MKKFFLEKMNICKIENIAFVLMFVIVLVLPLTKINYAEKSKTENRNLAKIVSFHKLKHSEFLNWTKSFENWLNDRFRGRDKVISAYKKFDYALTGRIANNRAMMGKNGWLFYIDKNDGNSLLNFQNKSRFSEAELVRIKNNIVRQKELLAAHGIDYYVLIAPDKNRIYGEYYPDYIHKVAEKSRTDLLIEYLTTEKIKVIYPVNELLQAKEKGYIYFPWDTHWNNYGAFIGYTQLMNDIKQKHPNIKSLKLDDFTVSSVKSTGGDLFNFLGFKMKDVENYNCDYLNLELKTRKWNYIKKEEARKKWGNYLFNSNPEPLNNIDVVLLRDSFTTAMVPYLSESFSNTHYFWTHNFNVVYPEILEIKPQIVAHEMVERYAPSLLIDVSKLKE